MKKLIYVAYAWSGVVLPMVGVVCLFVGGAAQVDVLKWTGLGLAIAGLISVVGLICFIALGGRIDPPASAASDDPSLLYADGLVEIRQEGITFLYYHGLPFTRKRVLFSSIGRAWAEQPRLTNGKWRICGTGDFLTWFPLDYNRPHREKLFFVTLRGSHRKIGFTVQHSEEVEAILGDQGLLGT